MSSRPRKKRATVEPPRAEHLESLERGLLVLELNTVRRYLRSGGYVVYKQPARESALNGLDSWLNERLQRHRGNADVVRQDLQREHRLAVSLRTVERAVAPFRRVLRAAEIATVRFETGPGEQLQIDFGETTVAIAGERVRVHLFVATLGYSRRDYDPRRQLSTAGKRRSGLVPQRSADKEPALRSTRYVLLRARVT